VWVTNNLYYTLAQGDRLSQLLMITTHDEFDGSHGWLKMDQRSGQARVNHVRFIDLAVRCLSLTKCMPCFSALEKCFKI
jgi:hypothetical protein